MKLLDLGDLPSLPPEYWQAQPSYFLSMLLEQAPRTEVKIPIDPDKDPGAYWIDGECPDTEGENGTQRKS